MSRLRVGIGYDVHTLVSGDKMILGGIQIPSTKMALGHSDADVLVHAIMDAILGALAMGDIGKHFPDSDPDLKGINSCVLLGRVKALMEEAGFDIVNLDTTLVLQEPKISAYIPEICSHMAEILGISPSQVSVKATTTEGLGYEGKGEGVAAHAIVLLGKS